MKYSIQSRILSNSMYSSTTIQDYVGLLGLSGVIVLADGVYYLNDGNLWYTLGFKPVEAIGALFTMSRLNRIVRGS